MVRLQFWMSRKCGVPIIIIIPNETKLFLMAKPQFGKSRNCKVPIIILTPENTLTSCSYGCCAHSYGLFQWIPLAFLVSCFINTFSAYVIFEGSTVERRYYLIITSSPWRWLSYVWAYHDHHSPHWTKFSSSKWRRIFGISAWWSPISSINRIFYQKPKTISATINFLSHFGDVFWLQHIDSHICNILLVV